MLRTQRGSLSGGRVCFNDRYAWEGDDYEPLSHTAELRRYALDGELEYWAADLELQPPRLRYRFGLETEDGLRWFGADGLRDTPAPRQAFEFDYIAEGDLPDSPAWAQGATFYHIFPDRFARSGQGHRRAPVDPWDAPVGKRTFLGGDLDGIVERLDHIASLSVDALYLTPIFTSPSSHKYDTTDYFSVDPDFGGNAALRRLVSALRERGMRLLLDGVFNHAGSEWAPFADARRRGGASPYADWFYFAQDSQHGYETWGTNIRTLPKLRTSHPEVRDLVCRIGRFWVQEFGVDGWRLDVAKEVDHATWRAFRSAVRAVNSDAFLVGEVWTSGLPWLRGDQFDSVMNYPWRDAILAYASGSDPDSTAFLDALDRIRVSYPEAVQDYLYNLLGSHDAARPLTVCGGDRRRFGLASALLFTLPGSVSIYYGDEIGMEGGEEPECRGGMVWEASRQDERLLALFRRLGALRRQQPSLRQGRYTRLYGDGPLAAFARGEGADRLVVAVNAGSEVIELRGGLLSDWLDGRPRVLETLGYGDVERASASRTGLRLAPASLTIISGGTG